jgi:hypothetical protein
MKEAIRQPISEALSEVQSGGLIRAAIREA